MTNRNAHLAKLAGCWSSASPNSVGPSSGRREPGVSRATAYKWLGRYRAEGRAGLADPPSRPRHCPHTLLASQVRRVLAARRRHRQGSHHLDWRLHLPCFTVYGVRGRHGMNRLSHTSGPAARSCATSASTPARLSTSTSRSWAASLTAAATAPTAGPRGSGPGHRRGLPPLGRR
jgi:hypothetical protein